MSRRLMSYVSSIVNIIRTVYIYTHTITHPLSSLSASYQHTIFIVLYVTYATNLEFIVELPENGQMTREEQNGQSN